MHQLKYYFSLFLITITSASFAQNIQTTDQKRWQITSPTSIQWNIENDQNLPHSDNIEMAGKRVAGIISYAVDTNRMLTLNRQIIYPQLHPFIKETDPDWYVYRAYLQDTYDEQFLPKLYIKGKEFVPEELKSVEIDGILKFVHEASESGIILERTLYPHTSKAVFQEHWLLTNSTQSTINITIGNTFFQEGIHGQNGLMRKTVSATTRDKIKLTAGASFELTTNFSANQGAALLIEDQETVLNNRKKILSTLSNSLILETPNQTLNTLFNFAKIRASESIFDSELGLIHSPGGGRYYVGIWANDQAEYVSPFFPYLGYETGNESALNCYRAFAKEINEDYEKIRYAFEIEGTVPPFLLDRGDAAMIAYGASQFVLAYGKEETAKELWPLIKWCLEYCNRQLNSEGIVQSESDEMEGRIETGTANLSTSALYYGALNLATDLANSLGQPTKIANKYQAQATTLKIAIENYFGATVEGLETYKYYKEHQYLRHWICLPLVVGIFDRKEATIEALFDRLWSENGGVHVEKNSENEAISKIFWDRGTLYAMRGTFLAGATEKSLKRLVEYSEKRLLGERVPYPVEAFPEGSMAHLSAESGLYCRIFTEGIFGIVPKSFKSFEMTPRLPESWNEMSLKNVKAFGHDFDIFIKRTGEVIALAIFNNANNRIVLDTKFSEGETIFVQL